MAKIGKKEKFLQGFLIFIQNSNLMDLKKILKDIENSQLELASAAQVDEPLVLNRALTLSGSDNQVTFVHHGSTLRLVGHGPFRFRGLNFNHSQELAPTFFQCEDALVVFEDCTFQGAFGGDVDSLAVAVRAKGRSRVSFERCNFKNNDIHFQGEGHSHTEFRLSVLQDARADGVRLVGESTLYGTEMEVTSSGWSGITCAGQSRLTLTASHLKENACHGVELDGESVYQGWQNIFCENGHNGLTLLGESSTLSQDEQFLSNGYCGLDLCQKAFGMVTGALSSHNKSHGYQLRQDSRMNFLDCFSGDNLGSGLALFDQSGGHGEDLRCENNFYSGIQSADASRLTLARATISQNGSSGISCFAKSKIVVERSRIIESGAFGFQLNEDSQATVRDCEVMENGRGGLVFAGRSQGVVESSTLAHNGLDGLVTSDRSRVTVLENLVRSNKRDGLLILSSGNGQYFDNQLLSNGRHGLYAGHGSRPLLSRNECRENESEQMLLETTHGRAANRSSRSQDEASTELPPGVTLSIEGGDDLHLPFEPKKVERTMLVALAKHGRLSEQALGKVAKTRRVGGAMENLIDRLNRAGMPLIRHDGDGPEGNIYAFKVDTTRTRALPGSRHQNRKTQGREIC